MSNPVFHNVVYLLCNSLFVYGKYKSMGVFFDKSKTSKKTIILLFAAYLVINSVLHLILVDPAVNLCSNLILFFLLTLNYESSVLKRLVATAAVYLVGMVMEILVYFVFISFAAEQDSTGAIVNVISSILFYFAVILLNNLKNIRKTENKISFPYLFALTAIFICSIYISIVIADEKIKNSNIYIALGIAAVLIINIFVVYIYDILNKNYQKELEHKLLEQQNDFYVRQLENMQQSQSDIRVMRHDMQNHMIAISSISDNNVKIRDYVNEYLQSTKDFKEYSKSGNVIIDSIVNYKLQEAENKGIENEVDIKIPPELNILPFDMGIILGNLLDNAIKAASKSANDKKIQIGIYFEKGFLYIQVENTFDGNVIMEGKKYKTTKADNINHGLGLVSVGRAVEKYDGKMDISHTESLFSVKILLGNFTKNNPKPL